MNASLPNSLPPAPTAATPHRKPPCRTMKTCQTHLLLAALALAGVVSAQEPVIVQRSVTNGNTVATATTVTSGAGLGGAGGTALPDLQRMFEEIQRHTQEAVSGAAAGNAAQAFGGGDFFNNAFAASSTARRSDAPELLLTRPLDATRRAECIEDLRVMDKLLRDGVSQAEQEVARQAMGIRLRITSQPQTPPQWIDGLAVVFRYDVNFPLAASGKAPPPAGRETNASSAWERARRELQGDTRAKPAPRRANTAPSAPFESERVESLIDSIALALAQARNIRHLDPAAAILVTVSGADDAGQPLRLTLRTTRRDLEKLPASDPSAAQARKAVTWSIQ